jgi:dihydroorotase
VIIRNAVVFTPTGRTEGDLRLEAGRIAEIGTVSREAEATIDADGRWIFPGAIDAHVHFRDPGFLHKEDWTTGSAAAVAGGVTTVFDMPNTDPTTTDPRALAGKRERAAAASRCNFGLFLGATTDNPEVYGAVDGVPGLKIYMGTSTGDLLVCEHGDLEEVFEAWDGLIAVHAEDQARLEERAGAFEDRNDPGVHSEIRDPEAAAIAVEQACDLAIDYERDLHVVHLSTPKELQALESARSRVARRGADIELSAEACPHHLFLDTEAYEELGTRARVNPPLRSPEAREATWEALRDGRIQFVATDHAPHPPEQKDRAYRETPSGFPGVQTMLPLLLDAADRGLCSPEDIVDWVAHVPARRYGLVDRGRLKEGAHADLTIVEPELEREVTAEGQFSKSGWTPWEGTRLRGWPVATIVGGELAFRRDGSGPGAIVGEPGLGRPVAFEE